MGDMSQSPNPVDRTAIIRAQRLVLVLVVGAIALFLVLWVLLGESGMNDFARLIISLCVPPGLITAILGGYFLFTVSHNETDPSADEPEDANTH